MPRRIMHLRARTERFSSAIGAASMACSSAESVFRLEDLGRSCLSVAYWPSRRPLVASISLISTRLVSPKFLLASSSCSVQRHRSPRVMMPIFCRQLRLRTESSKSVTGNAQHLAHAVAFLLRVFVVVLLVRGFGVLEEQRRPAMVGIDVQHPLIALRGPVVLLAIFVEQAEVHQRADVGGKAARRRACRVPWPRRRCRGGRFPGPGRTGAPG